MRLLPDIRSYCRSLCSW